MTTTRVDQFERIELPSLKAAMGVSRADADREVWAHAMAGKVKSKALSVGFNSDTPLVLSDLPHDLATALAGFDADGNGHVTVGELAEGARLLHSTQEKVRAGSGMRDARLHLSPSSGG